MQNQYQQGQVHQNMQTGAIPPQLNHGGHEVFDVHEVLSGAIGTLNTYTLCVSMSKIRNYSTFWIVNISSSKMNIIFHWSASKRARILLNRLESYKMNQGNDFIYGLTPTQPKKPCNPYRKLRMNAFQA